MAIQTLTVNVNAQPSAEDRAFLYLSQNENGRDIRFRVLGDDLPSGCTATLSGVKPDGNVWSKAGTVTNNFVVVEEDVQMTAVAGRWDAQLDIVNGSKNIVTALIRITVEAAAVETGAVPSDTQLEGYVEQCKQYAETAKNEAYGSPLTATTAAGMTDQGRVYVYTGSETGYTSGHWYYWDGTAWTDGGVYNSIAVDTDTTLSISGKAADAKKTGDEITELKSGLSDIKSEITRISGNVADALTAIGNKGVTVPSGANSDDLAQLIDQIQTGGGDEPTETLLGQTPYTLTEDANIKLVGDGSYTFSYTGTIADFSDRQNVTGTGAILTDEGSYYQLVDNGASAWYQSLVQMSFDGLTVGSSYTITVNGAGDGTTSTSGYWVIRDAGGNTSYGTINTRIGESSLTFEATTTSINVMLACTDSTGWDNGIRTAKFTDMVIAGAVEGSGSGDVSLGQLTAGTQITSSPSVEVYAIIESSSGTLRGKTCVCLGDSVTGLMAPPNDYPSVLASNTGMTVINGGFEGCRMSDTHPTATYAAFSAVKLADAIATGDWTTQDANISGFESGSYAPDHLTALKAVNWSNVDYITVEFGGNDAGDQYVYIDNASNPTDTTTYVGAARYVYNRIHTAYPNIKIIFFVPMYRYWLSDSKDSYQMTFSFGGNTYHYYDWGDALIASPPASGVPVVDMHRTLGIDSTNRQTYLLASDQTHPSVAGCALIANKVEDEIRLCVYR